MSFNAINFGTNGEPICDLLCVNNSNICAVYTTPEIWWIIGQIFVPQREIPLFNASEPLNPILQHLVSRN